MGKARARRQKLLAEPPFTVQIDNLSHEGRGVARRDGKAIFVEGALPGEEVRCLYTLRRSRHDEARVIEVLQAANGSNRAVPISRVAAVARCNIWNRRRNCNSSSVGCWTA